MQRVRKGGERCNKWKKDEQQMERAGVTGGDRMSNRWRMVLQQVEMEIAQQVGPASQIDESSQIARQPDSQIARQPDGLVHPGNQEGGMLEGWKVARKLERWKVGKWSNIGGEETCKFVEYIFNEILP